MAFDGTLKFDTAIDKKGFQLGISSLGGLAKSGISLITSSVTAASGAVSALGGYAVSVGKDFESSMSNVAAISGATADEFEALTNKAAELGENTIFSASEAADALSYMAMAGWKTEEMLSGVGGILDLAASSGADLATTSDIVTDALTAFGQQASDSGRLADIMAAAASNANTNVEMMGETFKYAAPVAGALGYTMEDTAVAIGLMANSGIKASQAGTALRSLMSRLAGPTKASQEAMDALGLSITDSSGRMKSFNTLMIEMREKFAKLSEAEQAEIAKKLAGTEAMSGLLAIVNASQKDFDKLTDAVNGSAGAASQMAEIMTDNLGGDLKELGSKAEAFGITLYNSFNEPLRSIVQLGSTYIKELIDSFNAGGYEGLAEGIGSVLGQAATKISELLPQLADLGASVIKSLTGGILNNIDVISGAASSILITIVDSAVDILPDILTAALKIINTLADGLADNAPRLADAAATGIIKIVDGISKNLPNIAASGVKIITTLASSLSNNLPELKNSVRRLITSFGEVIKNNLPDIISAAVEIIESIATAIAENVDVILDTALTIIETLAMSLVDNIEPIVEAAVDIVTSIAVWISQNADKVAATALEIVRALASALIKNAPELIGAAAVLIFALVDALINMMSGINDTLSKWGKQLVSSIGSFLGDLYDCAIESAEEMIEYIDDFWSDVGKSVANAIASLGRMIKGAYDSAVDSTQKFIENTVNFFKTLPGKIADTLSDALNKVKSWGTDAYNSAVNGAESLIEGVVTAFTTLPSKIGSTLLDSLTAVGTWAADLLQKGRDAASDLVDAVVNGVTSLPDELFSIGEELVSGLWDGIQSCAGWLGDKISGFGETFVGKVKGVFKINSPSRVMRDSVGIYLAQGVGEGFTAEIPEVGKAALAAMKNTFKPTVDIELDGDFPDNKPFPRVDSSAVAALEAQRIHTAGVGITPSPTSEITNNHYYTTNTTSTVNNAPEAPTTPINVSLYVDGHQPKAGLSTLRSQARLLRPLRGTTIAHGNKRSRGIKEVCRRLDSLA